MNADLYPRYPVGLQWDTRMANQIFDAYMDTSVPTPSVRAEAVQPKRNHNKAKDSSPRTFASRYVGVTLHRQGWVASLGRKQGPARPFDDAGELQAGWDRAIALGRPGVEERPPEQVRPAEETRVLQARGPHKKRLGGKRLA